MMGDDDNGWAGGQQRWRWRQDDDNDDHDNVVPTAGQVANNDGNWAISGWLANGWQGDLATDGNSKWAIFGRLADEWQGDSATVTAFDQRNDIDGSHPNRDD